MHFFRVAGAAGSHPFWLEPEPFFWSGSYSYFYSTENILFLRDPKYEHKYGCGCGCG